MVDADIRKRGNLVDLKRLRNRYRSEPELQVQYFDYNWQYINKQSGGGRGGDMFM